MEVEDRLPCAAPSVDDDTVVAHALACRDLRDEVEHPLGLGGRELGDVVERVDVALGQHEQVRVGLRVDVADGDEAVSGGDVVAVAVEPAEESVLGAHAARTPSSETAAPRTGTSSPTGSSGSTSQGE